MYRKVSDLFSGVSAKVLAAVDVNPRASHQHEINGNRNLVKVLGDPFGIVAFDAILVYLNDDLTPVVDEVSVSWYDVRRKGREERGTGRSPEPRLYYQSNAVMQMAKPGDLLILARETGGGEGQRLLMLVCQAGTSVALQASELFGLSQDALRFEPGGDLDREIDFTEAVLLEALGYEPTAATEDHLDEMLAKFHGTFPTTREFSEFAREVAAVEHPSMDPDGALLEWATVEERLFRTLERHIVSSELEEAQGDVESTLEIAQRTFQRRKSRAGQSLENHLEHLLGLLGVANSRGQESEDGKRPDFLFPSVEAYLDDTFPVGKLRVLGVKTTCKDRWRQVLSEADRIPRKHLLTLEAPISEKQLAQMEAKELTLVIPRELHERFPESQRSRLMDVATFIAHCQPDGSAR